MANELIERLEAATGPDRELDAAIAEAVGHTVKYDKADLRDTTPWYQPVPDYSWQPVPQFSASIDAALTLVPEGLNYELTTTGYKPGATVCGNILTGPHEGAYAATPALAICIAALRAKNSQ